MPSEAKPAKKAKPPAEGAPPVDASESVAAAPDRPRPPDLSVWPDPSRVYVALLPEPPAIRTAPSGVGERGERGIEVGWRILNQLVQYTTSGVGRCKAKDVIPYWVAQLVAGLAAAFVAVYLVGKNGTPMKMTNASLVFVAEFLFTFALAFVVLNSATSKDTANNSFYGLAIGMTVMVGAFSVGSISGGAFNPAVAVGLVMMKLVHFANVWIHIVAELAGGLAAGLIFKVLNPTDK